MKKLIILAAALPACLSAGPVNFASYLLAEGTQSDFTHTSGIRDSLTADSDIFSAYNLANGTLRVYNQRTAGVGSLASQAIIYDTLTFDHSAFQGAFGATYDLVLTGHYEGSFQLFSGAIHDAGLGGRIQVYSGDTVINASVFADTDSLIDFLFISGPAPICASGVNGPDLTTFNGNISFNVHCNTTVDQDHATVRFFMFLGDYINDDVPAVWTLDMSHTATLDLGDLGGRTVYSGSGVLPGTQAFVPEPGTLLLFALGAGALGLARFQALRRRFA